MAPGPCCSLGGWGQGRARILGPRAGWLRSAEPASHTWCEHAASCARWIFSERIEAESGGGWCGRCWAPAPRGREQGAGPAGLSRRALEQRLLRTAGATPATPMGLRQGLLTYETPHCGPGCHCASSTTRRQHPRVHSWTGHYTKPSTCSTESSSVTPSGTHTSSPRSRPSPRRRGVRNYAVRVFSSLKISRTLTCILTLLLQWRRKPFLDRGEERSTPNVWAVLLPEPVLASARSSDEAVTAMGKTACWHCGLGTFPTCHVAWLESY